MYPHKHKHTCTHTTWALKLPVYPNPSWKVSTCPTKGRWVTCLQTLNLGQAGEPQKGGWVMDNSRDLGQKTWFRYKHHAPCTLYDVHAWWIPVVGLQDEHEGPHLVSTTWSGTRVHMCTHTHTYTHIHIHIHTHTHTYTHTHKLV